MEKILFPILGVLCALPLIAADPKDDVKAAVKSLADKPNYTWTTTVKSPGAQFNAGPTTGKTQKGGYTFLTQVNNEQTTEVAMKGTNGVVKTEEGWKSQTELPAPQRGGAAGGNRGAMAGRFLLNSRTPTETLTNLVEKVKELKKGEDDLISGDLTEEGAKEYLSFRRQRPGGNNQGPTTTDAKGSLKVWLKGGQLVKYQIAVSGKMNFNGNERDIDRTTTVEIKDVDKTNVEVPDDAKKKIAELGK